MGCGASAKHDFGKGQMVSQNELYPEPQLGKDSKAIDVIIWGAQSLKYTEVLGLGGAYCIARVGPTSADWKELPRGMGRRSIDICSAEPSWNMAFIIDIAGIQEPALHVRVYDKEFMGEDVFLAEGKVSVDGLLSASEPTTVLLGPDEAGTLSISGGQPGFLKKIGVPPSAQFPEMKVMGAVKHCEAKDVNGDFPLRVGKAPLPAAVRGVFWLSNQRDSSALASFGGPSNDGGGCSVGELLSADGASSGDLRGRYKIRCGGDRTWAEASMGPVSRHPQLDLVYHFVFDSAAEPTKAQIYPEWKIIPRSVGTAEFLGDFEMTLIKDDPDFPGSVIWLRNSWILGQELKASEYKLVQIMDEDGKRIEPAFTKFVDYQNARQGDNPGRIYYREVEQVGTTG